MANCIGSRAIPSLLRMQDALIITSCSQHQAFAKPFTGYTAGGNNIQENTSLC